MSPSSDGTRRGTGLAIWLIVIVIAVVVIWGVWHFGRLQQHPARNNPGVSTTSALILDKV